MPDDEIELEIMEETSHRHGFIEGLASEGDPDCITEYSPVAYDVRGQRKPTADPNIISDAVVAEKMQYTFSSVSYYNFLLTAYVIQKFIKTQKHISIISIGTGEFEYGHNRFEEVLIKGSIAFEYEDFLVVYQVDSQGLMSTLRMSASINKLVKTLKHELKWNNPLRGKFVQILDVNGTHYPVIKKTPNISFDQVILNAQLKSDIYDNTIYQLKYLEDNNGVIFYGKPGVGKSHICGAITNEANKDGYTVCYLTTQTDYSMLNEFIKNFIAPCILIFEDIDSFAESRLSSSSHSLADFLQFINGIGDRDERIIFIATTNYLEKLDEAISNRPMRFNRKFEFNFPDKTEISQLIELYFSKETAEKYAHLCTDIQFSGAHIKEIKRTAKLRAKKKSVSIDEVFQESFELVKKNFSTELKPFGFNK